MMVMDSSYATLIAVVGTVCSVVVGAILTNRLTFRRSSREKLWDLRRETYSYIVVRLSRAKKQCADINEYLADDPQRFWNLDKNTTMDRFYEGIREAFERYSDDNLICSPEFILIFEQFDAATNPDPYNDGPDDTYDLYSTALKKFVPKLVAQAGKEINPEGCITRRRLR
jgi:hypothetical protein